MRKKNSDQITADARATRDRLERYICTCTHAQLVHGSTLGGLAAGHGQCYVGGCRCLKFSWHHELPKTEELYRCEGCGHEEKRPAGTKQWHGCHPAKFRMYPAAMLKMVDRTMRAFFPKARKVTR